MPCQEKWWEWDSWVMGRSCRWERFFHENLTVYFMLLCAESWPLLFCCRKVKLMLVCTCVHKWSLVSCFCIRFVIFSPSPSFFSGMTFFPPNFFEDHDCHLVVDFCYPNYLTYRCKERHLSKWKYPEYCQNDLEFPIKSLHVTKYKVI